MRAFLTLIQKSFSYSLTFCYGAFFLFFPYSFSTSFFCVTFSRHILVLKFLRCRISLWRRCSHFYTAMFQVKCIWNSKLYSGMYLRIITNMVVRPYFFLVTKQLLKCLLWPCINILLRNIPLYINGTEIFKSSENQNCFMFSINVGFLP
jgi:hypothetical protein